MSVRTSCANEVPDGISIQENLYSWLSFVNQRSDRYLTPMKYRVFGVLGLGAVMACAGAATEEDPSGSSGATFPSKDNASSSSSGSLGSSTSSSASSSSSSSSSGNSNGDGGMSTSSGNPDAGSAEGGTSAPSPTITAIAPAQGGAAGATTVTITGTHFVGAGTRVKFGTANGAFVSSTDTSIVVISPGSSRAGAVDITVDWTSGRLVSMAAGFRYVWSVVGFQSRTTLAGIGALEALVTGDFNRDGTLDIVAGAFNGDAQIFFGNGDRTFRPASTIALGGSGRVVAADFNNDGILDLASTWSAKNQVRVVLGNGAGGFDAARTFTAPLTPIGLSAADLDGDGKVDLVANCIGANKTAVLLGQGDGNFKAATSYEGSGDYASVIADMNGDKKLDLVVTSLSAARVMLFLGNGDGTFAGFSSIAMPQVPIGVAIGDLNGDGRPDVVATRQNGSDIFVALNSGGGAFASATTKIVSGAGSIKGITLGDMDADGKLDALFGGTSGNAYVVRGLGDGTFASPLSFFSSAAGPETHGFAIADFDNDTKPDFVMTSGAGVQLYIGDQN